MKKRIKAGIISVILIFSMLLTGCGEKKITPPELIDSVSSNEAFRPVDYGNIGNTVVKDGVVVPEDYCHFWYVPVVVDNIKVNIGDYVNKGDVIAVADLNQAKETLTALQDQLTLLESNFSIKEDIYEYDKKELEYNKKACEEESDSLGAAAVDVQLSVLEENFRYDNMLHNHYVQDLEDSISKQQQVIDDGTLVARQSGYVTYVKDISASNMANGAENIVIISDYDNCYIELTGVTLREKLLKTYPFCYTMSKGEKLNLVEYSYSAEEMVVCQGKGMSPTLRLKYEDQSIKLLPGDNVPVFLNKKLIENVMVIGNDSLYQDSTGSFVYVKTDAGKEVRYIEVGENDDYYTQVVSGLEEGELVYYSSESVLPDEYSEYTVDFSDFSVYMQTQSYSVKNTKKTVFYSEYEGQITEVLPSDGDYVNQGQLICKIKTNEGSATLVEMKNNIQSMKDGYEQTMKSFDEQIALCEEQIENYGLPKKDDIPEGTEVIAETDVFNENVASDSDATEEKVNPYGKEILICQLEKIKLNKKSIEINYNSQLAAAEEAYKKASCNNDGTGTISVFAEKSGYFADVTIRTGKNIEIGNKLFSIEEPSKSMISVTTDDQLTIGKKLTFYDKDSEKRYEGTICGISGSPMYGKEKQYISTINEKVYITSNAADTATRYFVLMDDESFYEKDCDCIVMYPTKVIYDTVVLPKLALCGEEVIGEQEKSFYVWKLVDGELVKQYVIYAGQNAAGESCIISGISAGDVLAVVGLDEEEDTEE